MFINNIKILPVLRQDFVFYSSFEVNFGGIVCFLLVSPFAGLLVTFVVEVLFSALSLVAFFLLFFLNSVAMSSSCVVKATVCVVFAVLRIVLAGFSLSPADCIVLDFLIVRAFLFVSPTTFPCFDILSSASFRRSRSRRAVWPELKRWCVIIIRISASWIRGNILICLRRRNFPIIWICMCLKKCVRHCTAGRSRIFR